MVISAHDLHRRLKQRYPNAKIYILDQVYDVPEEALIKKAYSNFIRRMAVSRLTAWVKNVGDCDKWAWILKASVILKAWLSGQKNSTPFGLLCYYDDTLKTNHAINNGLWRNGGNIVLREIEPQPRGGIKDITQKERESAWLIIV